MDTHTAEDPLAPQALVEAAARANAEAEALERLEQRTRTANTRVPREFRRMLYRSYGRSEGLRHALTLGA